MPLLDIAATAQPSFQSYKFTCRAQTLLHNKFVFGNEKRLAFGWKSFQLPKRVDNLNSGGIFTRRSVLVISAVATLEHKLLVQSNGALNGQATVNLGVDSSSTFLNQDPSLSEETEEVNDREKLRRMRISKANKGNTPWNKGRKHSPETLRRIKERTRLAMQNPKVKMKLVNLGHSQSQETRVKIGVGVRMGWERRREKLLLQETCHFDWQNMIAEASRKGFVGEEELQWDSYKIMNDQLELEWLQSVEERRKAPRPKGSKRAPKSLEQRKKISQAIAAKWADPSYRDRVCSALSKYHGVEVGAEKPKKIPRSERPPKAQGQPTKKRTNDTDYFIGKVNQSKTPRSKRRNAPLFKDPLASSKLEMIKNIRAERAAADSKKTEAIAQAKLLIAEAEKAAKALEAAALRSPVAQASLNETRKLIAEAIQSIQSIEGQITTPTTPPLIDSTGQVNNSPKENHQEADVPRQAELREINGTKSVESSERDVEDFGFGEINLQDLLDGVDEVFTTSSVGSFTSLNGDSKEEHLLTGSGGYGLSPSEVDSSIPELSFTEQLSQLQVNGNNGHLKKPQNGTVAQSKNGETRSSSGSVKKKWIRGRLVEVVEEEEEEEEE